eukprot:gb/GECH01013569.1/.p1 GENE.gb/GECH01013569.1/~~gb/GECH01013569.1/.p1  ORF type:complete len:814 (+),score=114.52 gb/GECH01013569.1/:1-2442(+)
MGNTERRQADETNNNQHNTMRISPSLSPAPTMTKSLTPYHERLAEYRAVLNKCGFELHKNNYGEFHVEFKSAQLQQRWSTLGDSDSLFCGQGSNAFSPGNSTILPWDSMGSWASRMEDGCLMFDQRCYTEAHDIFSHALKSAPKSTPSKWLASVHYLKALTHVALNQIKEATIHCDTTLELDPDNLRALTLRSALLMQQSKYREALSVQNEVLASEPNALLALVNRGVTHFNLEQYHDALEDFVRIKEEFSAYPWGMYLAGWARSNLPSESSAERQDNLREALEEIKGSLSICPHPKFYSELTSVYLMMNDVTSAIEVLNDALELFPLSVRIAFLRSQVLAMKDRPQEAIDEVERVMDFCEEDEEQVLCYNQRANILVSLGRHKEAISDYRRAIKISPRNEMAMFNCAVSCANIKALDDAEELCDRIIAVGAHHELRLFEFAEVYHLKGHICRALGRGMDAIHNYSLALQVDPNKPSIYSSRGEMYNQLGIPRKAADDLASAIKMLEAKLAEKQAGLRQPILKKTLRQVSKVWDMLSSSRDSDDADKEKDVADEDEDIEKIRQNLAHVYARQAKFLSKVGAKTQALDAINASIVHQPEAADMYYIKAKHLVSMGQPQDAEEQFQQAIRIQEGHSSSFEESPVPHSLCAKLVLFVQHLAQLYRSQDENSRAVEAYSKCIYTLENLLPSDSDSHWRLLALVYFHRSHHLALVNKLAECRQDLDRTLVLHPRQPTYLNRAGQMSFRMERYADALRFFSAALDVEDKAEYYWNRAHTYFQLKRFADALKDFDKSALRNPAVFGEKANHFTEKCMIVE